MRKRCRHARNWAGSSLNDQGASAEWRLAARRWLHEAGCTKLVCAELVARADCIELTARSWLHGAGCMKLAGALHLGER